MGDQFLYPSIKPYNTGILKVSSIHTIYYEESGNKDGIPGVFLHAGPGAAASERDKRYFDPEAYRIITFDQRGCGKSRPSFCIEENDTWKLVEDMETLREYLCIKKWLILGGSWGSFLALTYAETHIDKVLALVLHGVFAFRQEEVNWIFQQGASFLFPEYWDEFVSPIPEEERDNMLSAYDKRFHSDDKEEAIRSIFSWCIWEACNTRLRVSPEKIKAVREMSPEEGLACAKFGIHFYRNLGFLKTPNQILENAYIIRDSGVPVTIVQGRYDVICPMKTAWELHKALGNSEFFLVDNAGHSSKEEGITKNLVGACDKFKDMFCAKKA